jgi:steroid delta-isomerase-like uncharacterized protein
MSNPSRIPPNCIIAIYYHVTLFSYIVRLGVSEREMLLVTQCLWTQMAIINNDNLLNQIIEAENAHDVERLIALVTDDIVIEDVPFVPFGMVMKGKDGVRQGYAFFFEAAPDYKIEPKSWVTSDKSFASEWVLTATQKGDFPGIPASGKRFSIRGCSFGEFENGKLKRKSDYWDYASLAKQLSAEESR